MNKKRGFTVVELIGVVVILGIILTIIVLPIVRNVQNSKERVHEAQEQSILLALKNWATDNKASLPEREGESITLTLRDLQNLGYLEMNLTDNLSGKCLSGDIELSITKEGNSYEYRINYETATDDCSGGHNPRGPIIILNGRSLEYVELGEEYIDPGAIAKTYLGEDISYDMDIVIGGDGDVIDTSNFYNYVIIYSITDNDITRSVKRTVIVQDKTPPVLNIPPNASIPASQTSFNLMDGVTATDNSGNVNVTIEGTLSLGQFGTYHITYVAKDNSGNTTRKTRIITVMDDLAPSATVSVQGTPFNSNNWSKTDINLIVNISDDGGAGAQGYKYCLTTATTCVPSIDVKKVYDIVTVSTASATNRICIASYDFDNNVSPVQCFGPYAIDKTAPTCSVGLSGTVGSNSWYTSNVAVSLTRNDALSGVETFGLTTSTTATYNSSASVTHNTDTASVTYYGYVRDLAGNTVSCNNNFKRDASTPTLTLAVAGTPFNASNWARANFNINATTTASSSGVANITHCSTTSTSCTPSTNITGTSGSIAVSTESSTNYVCAYTTNNAGTKSATQCVGPYKLDKTNPTCSVDLSGTVGSNSWYTSNVSISLTRNDNLSAVSGYGLTTSATATYNSTASSSYSTNTTGVTYYGYVQDTAGNIGSCSSSFKRDATAPTTSLSRAANENAYGWYQGNVNVNISTSSTSGSAYIYHCTNSGGTCTPGTYVAGGSATSTASGETNNNYVCAYSVSNAGLTSTTVCNGPQRIDKTNPSIWHSGNVSLTTNSGSQDVWSGVGWSDNLSGVRTVWSSGSVSFGTAGTYYITYYAEDHSGRQAATTRTYTITPASIPGGSGDSGTWANSNGSAYVYTNSLNAKPRYTYNISWGTATKNGNTFSIASIGATFYRDGTTWSTNSCGAWAGGCGSCDGWGGGNMSTSSGSTQIPATVSRSWGAQSCSSSSNSVQVCVQWRSGNWAASSNIANLTKAFNF